MCSCVRPAEISRVVDLDQWQPENVEGAGKEDGGEVHKPEGTKNTLLSDNGTSS